MLSTLTLQEFVFTLAKLKIDNDIIKEDSEYYFSFVNVEQDYVVLKEAIELCCDENQCKNINDVMHLLLAEKAKCSRLITFDGDFKKLDGVNDVRVEVLQLCSTILFLLLHILWRGGRRVILITITYSNLTIFSIIAQVATNKVLLTPNIFLYPFHRFQYQTPFFFVHKLYQSQLS